MQLVFNTCLSIKNWAEHMHYKPLNFHLENFQLADLVSHITVSFNYTVLQNILQMGKTVASFPSSTCTQSPHT